MCGHKITQRNDANVFGKWTALLRKAQRWIETELRLLRPALLNMCATGYVWLYRQVVPVLFLSRAELSYVRNSILCLNSICLPLYMGWIGICCRRGILFKNFKLFFVLVSGKCCWFNVGVSLVDFVFVFNWFYVTKPRINHQRKLIKNSNYKSASLSLYWFMKFSLGYFFITNLINHKIFNL